MTRLVTVFNRETRQTSEIPLVELGPNMGLTYLQGVGEVWMDTTTWGEPVFGPLIRPPLSKERRRMIKTKIMRPLSAVYPKSLADWEDGFRRDVNAEAEIDLWLCIAEHFTAFLNKNRLDKAQQQEVFQLMLRCTVVPDREAFWATAQPQHLTRAQVEAVIAPFEGNWRSMR